MLSGIGSGHNTLPKWDQQLEEDPSFDEYINFDYYEATSFVSHGELESAHDNYSSPIVARSSTVSEHSTNRSFFSRHLMQKIRPIHTSITSTAPNPSPSNNAGPSYRPHTRLRKWYGAIKRSRQHQGAFDILKRLKRLGRRGVDSKDDKDRDVYPMPGSQSIVPGGAESCEVTFETQTCGEQFSSDEWRHFSDYPSTAPYELSIGDSELDSLTHATAQLNLVEEKG
jgi:hypothetical protein